MLKHKSSTFLFHLFEHWKEKMHPYSDAEAQKQDVDNARKMFYGGFLLLPWLWVVSAWYHYPQVKQRRCHPDLRKWVLGSITCACVAGILVITWVLTVHQNWKSWGATSMMVSAPDSDITGW
uniref:Gamma-secretase subunit PEN-2 n=1 Tax=Fibrocapsa japonica TaxID=94617 RepID=A0A6U1LMJ5_9STRA|mmetsp:Transcript_11355/g.16749  ORF Transcript_11355/g.16749 Transcript_11355/m.16749 type:complete len:122 (+) Transcript_11355:3-368(+)